MSKQKTTGHRGHPCSLAASCQLRKSTPYPFSYFRCVGEARGFPVCSVCLSFINFLCACVNIYLFECAVHVYSYPQKLEKVLDLLELQLQVLVRFPMWVLGTERPLQHVLFTTTVSPAPPLCSPSHLARCQIAHFKWLCGRIKRQALKGFNLLHVPYLAKSCYQKRPQLKV